MQHFSDENCILDTGSTIISNAGKKCSATQAQQGEVTYTQLQCTINEDPLIPTNYGIVK